MIKPYISPLLLLSDWTNIGLLEDSKDQVPISNEFP